MRIETLFSGFSAGTELTFLKGTNPYLHSRWEAERGVFVSGEAGAHFPVPFLGYMEAGRVIESQVRDMAPGVVLGGTYGHKSGHTADPFHELLVALPDDIDPMLGIFVGQMGPIAANGILHADAAACGGAVTRLGQGLEGRPVVVIGGGTVGILTALFARRAGAEVILAEPSSWRRDLAERLGLTAMTEDQACDHAKARFQHGGADRGADFVFQTRAHSDSLHLGLRALRPQGTVIDLAFYQGGADRTRLGEEFHHNGLAIQCAQIGRVPRPLAASWDRRRLAGETIELLKSDGAAIRSELISHVVPIDEVPDFLHRLVEQRMDFAQIVFAYA